MQRIVLGLAAFGLWAGCGAAPSPEAPAAQQAALAAPEIPAGCPPEKANEKGVGGLCTKGGRQCRGTAAPFCSMDATDTAPVPFCTRPCATDRACGSGAKCTAAPNNPLLRGCVPTICLPQGGA